MVKKSVVAAILSFIVPGLGHVWPVGMILRGALWFILDVIVSVVLFFASLLTGFPLGYIGIIIPLLAAYDAYKQGESKLGGQQF